MSELKFSKEHEWVKRENEIAVVGISEFAQDQLGEIVSIELPKLRSLFKKGQTVALVDSVKASSDIYAPIGGEIVEVNNELLEKPEIINQSPYELGWILKIRPSNMEEFESLMTEEQYDRYIGEIK
ncbi:MAG TPA: glycine cleavage system protein GcvH [Nitrososphaera sp.]|jgi:glycine cleavage system H protein